MNFNILLKIVYKYIIIIKKIYYNYNMICNRTQNPLDTYNYVYQQFISIKNSNSFNTFTILQPSDLILINNDLLYFDTYFMPYFKLLN